MEETFYANCSCEDPIRTEPGKWQHEDGPVRVLRGGSWGNTLSSAARCFSHRQRAWRSRLRLWLPFGGRSGPSPAKGTPRGRLR